MNTCDSIIIYTKTNQKRITATTQIPSSYVIWDTDCQSAALVERDGPSDVI